MSVKGIYINLDRHDARRSDVEAELAKAGWSDRFERFAAINGHDAADRPELVNRAEVGCFLSHLNVLKRNAGHDGWLHVVEDDVVVSRHAEAALASLLALPGVEDCDMLFTNVLLPQESWVVASFVDLFDRSVETDAAGEVTGLKSVGLASLDQIDFLLTTSYLVNPRAIGRIADILAQRLEETPFLPIDAVYQRLVRGGELRAMCVTPFLTAPRLGGPSTIRDTLSPWRVSHMIMEMALFADRDVGALQRLLASLEHTARDGVTRDLIAQAYRYALGSEVNSAVSI